ncbi:MAG TPA: preprotein translocase subunit SecE [Candidatus Saccharimonadales bacterium]|nr:preprotein translocase subunit SecE [Candidatus Saccharimonadales bacterium]
MADTPAKKRRVKNPETFRERALKAADSGKKPKPASRLRSVGKKATAPVTGPVRQTVSKLYNSAPLKPVRIVLRFLDKVLFLSYFRKSWQELKLVTWPNWKESQRLTFAVLVFAIVFGAAIAGVDWGLDKVFKQILLK